MRGKKVLKKWMAIALVCALVISAMGLDRAINAQAEDEVIENLVSNGDFDSEDGIDASGWTPGEREIEKETVVTEVLSDSVNGGTTKVSEVYAYKDNGSFQVESDDTDYALKLTKDSANTTYAVGIDQIQNIAADREYTVSFKLKNPANSGIKFRPLLTERVNSKWHNNGTEKMYYTTANSEWETKEYKFTATGTAESGKGLFLQFHLEGAGGTVYLDDIKITYISGEQNKAIVTEHIKNGDFSSAELNWSVATGDTGSLSLDGEEMKLDGSFRAQYNDSITATKNQAFTISYKTRGAAGLSTTRVNLRIIERDAKGNGLGNPHNYEMDNRTPTVAGSVASKTHTVKSESASHIEVQIVITNADATVWIDDFSLTSQEYVYGDGITLNGTDYEMQLSDGNSAIYSGAEFTANTWYRYSYDVVADGTLTKAGLKVGDGIKTSTSGTFKYVDGQGIGFATAGEGKAYFDNLIIQKISGTGELIANGTFDVTDETTTSGYADWDAGAEKIITQGNNLVSNGGFQTTSTTANVGATSWHRRSGVEGSATCIDDEDVSGNKVLKMSFASGAKSTEVGMSSYITLKPSTEYEINFKLKVFANTNANERYVYFTTGAVVKATSTSMPQIGEVIYKTINNDWQNITLTYKTPSDLQASSNFLLYFKMGNFSGMAYVDDVKLYQKEIVTYNNPVVSETTAQGMAGVDLSGDQCYLETEVAETKADASYILTMNTAGSGKINLINDEQCKKIAELTGDTVTAKKYLVSSSEATSYKLRFIVDGQNTTLFLGNVSMYMNRGDFDCDNYLEEDDFATMREALLGIADADALSFCDLTGDGVGTVTDLIRMKLYAVGSK